MALSRIATFGPGVGRGVAGLSAACAIASVGAAATYTTSLVSARVDKRNFATHRRLSVPVLFPLCLVAPILESIATLPPPTHTQTHANRRHFADRLRAPPTGRCQTPLWSTSKASGAGAVRRPTRWACTWSLSPTMSLARFSPRCPPVRFGCLEALGAAGFPAVGTWFWRVRSTEG